MNRTKYAKYLKAIKNKIVTQFRQ